MNTCIAFVLLLVSAFSKSEPDSQRSIGQRAYQELKTERLVKALLDILPKKVKEQYKSLNKESQKKIRKKIHEKYGDDLKEMLETEKDGNIVEALTIDNGGGYNWYGVPGLVMTCFSGASTVQTKQGVLSLKELMLGDSVLTVSHDKGIIYTEFLGWLHREANVKGNFLKISTNSTSIGLTPTHLIFRTSVADGSLESVFANEIEEGDKLVSWKGSKTTEVEVVAVEHIGETGFWAPLTTEGTLLVDGLLASCYADFPHSLSDLALAPVKMFPTMLLDDEESLVADGEREVVKLLIKMGTAIGLEQREGNQIGEKENPKKGGNPLPALAAVGSSKHIEL